MKRMTLFTLSVEEINSIDYLLSIVYWAKEKIKETLPNLNDDDCYKRELSVVALRLEQALDRGNKAILDEK